MTAWPMPIPLPPDEALSRLGIGLRRARWRCGMTQRQLSTASGVPQSTISRIENGLRPTAKAATIARLVHILGAVEIPPRASD
jgi:transcriptional regulator with XRE-family HTH domain